MTTDTITREILDEEVSEAAVRAQLGLRPTYYDSNPPPSQHPDSRPCPSWCALAHDDDADYGHEVWPGDPMAAAHIMEEVPAIVASQYAAPRTRGDDS